MLKRVLRLAGQLAAAATILAAMLIVTAPLIAPLFERARFLYSLANDARPAQLPSPIAVSRSGRLIDSWDAPRSGGRRHEGIDIFAAKGTPVRSTTRGIVARVGTNTLGGRTVTVLGPGLERHYYAHLGRYADIHEGEIVEAGDVLGYVGNTGNARFTPPHLHYGIYLGGRAENPFPRLAPRAARLHRSDIEVRSSQPAS